MKLRDGTVTHSSIPKSMVNYENAKPQERNSIILARVDEVVFADDDRNTSKNRVNKQVQYNLTILEGSNIGGRIFNAIDGQVSGDGYNYNERVRRPTSRKFQGPKADSLLNTDGEYVLVTYLGGSSNCPVIIGSISHPLSSAINKDSSVSWSQEYNGIKVAIDKGGNFSISGTGGTRNSQGQAESPDGAGTFFNVGANGDLSFGDGSQGLTIGKSGGTCKLSGSAVTVSSTGQMNVSASGGMTLSANGTTSITGAIVSIGGGGPPAATLGDTVMVSGVTSSVGSAYVAFGQIITGSSVVLLGG